MARSTGDRKQRGIVVAWVAAGAGAGVDAWGVLLLAAGRPNGLASEEPASATGMVEEVVFMARNNVDFTTQSLW